MAVQALVEELATMTKAILAVVSKKPVVVAAVPEIICMLFAALSPLIKFVIFAGEVNEGLFACLKFLTETVKQEFLRPRPSIHRRAQEVPRSPLSGDL